MEVIQDFIDQENSLLLCGFIDDELVSLLSIQGEQKERLKHIGHFAITVKKNIEYGDCFNDDGRSFRNDQRNIFKSS